MAVVPAGGGLGVPSPAGGGGTRGGPGGGWKDDNPPPRGGAGARGAPARRVPGRRRGDTDGPAALPAGYRGGSAAGVRGGSQPCGGCGVPALTGGVGERQPWWGGVHANPSPSGGGGFTGGAGDLVGGIMSWWGPPKMLLYCENNCVLNCLLGHLALEKTEGADESGRHTGWCSVVPARRHYPAATGRADHGLTCVVS